MAYLGREPIAGEVIVLDSIESQFNGSLTTFNLTRQFGTSTVPFYPVSSEQLLVSLGGVIQRPDRTGNVGFYINTDEIVFAVAPPAGTSCFIVSYGNITDIGTPADNSVTTTKIADGSITPSKLSTGGPYWDTSGNLGIGTSSPSEKLEVVGNLIVRSDTSNLLIYNPGTGFSGTMIANDSFHTALNGKVVGTNGGTGQIVIGGTITADTSGSNFNIGIGYGSSVNGTECIAIGRNAVAAGNRSVAIGYNSNAPDGTTVITSNGSERLRIDSTGNVGIGTTTPSSYFGNCDNLVIAGSGNIGLTISSSSASEAGIAFADGTSGSSAYIGRVVYNHSLDRMQFDTNALPRVYIDSSGHLLPAADATYDLGSTTNAWRNIYTNDLNLSNEKMDKGNDIDGTKGNWTIQEGETDLYIINNKNGKKYRFALEEIA